ncbi:MAG: hypothetical protein WCJ35_21710 [Planctomycetota bacterium]
MRRISWREILAEPEVTQLRCDAQSVAENERWSWYPQWLPKSEIFTHAVYTLAERFNCERDAIKGTLQSGLLDAYWSMKTRLKKAVPKCPN